MESKHYLYVDNPFSKYAYKGNHLTKSEECKVEHPQRVVSHYFQNCSTKSIEDLDQFRYQSEKASSLREWVKKSELPPKISKDSRKRPKVEKPRKSKRKTKPFLKADRCREAYKRKTLDNNWVPPPSGFECPLLQESHFHDPWRVIVICMLLNRTLGKQVHSSKYFFSFSLSHPLYFMLMFFCSS